jgi:hypothetical protein
MTPRELLALAQQQPVVEVQRTVSVPGPELQALLNSGRPLLVSELTAHPDQRSEQRLYRYGHVFGGPVSDSAIADWQHRHPCGVFLAQLIDLLKTADGIHLWADLDSGRSYFGILPIADWLDTRDHDASPIFDDLPDRVPAGTSVISYHDNGDYFLLLSPSGDSFTWFDPQSPDDSKVVGRSVEQFLAWWWDYCQELDPRVE